MSEERNSGASKSLWVGDIEQWMDEAFLKEQFGKKGEVLKVKIIRDKDTDIPVGFGFVEFDSHETAARILDDYLGPQGDK